MCLQFLLLVYLIIYIYIINIIIIIIIMIIIINVEYVLGQRTNVSHLKTIDYRL